MKVGRSIFELECCQLEAKSQEIKLEKQTRVSSYITIEAKASLDLF